MHRLAVVGNPIQHSLSPLVFDLFARQFSVKLSYDKILAQDADDFKTKVDAFFNQGGLALNITSPFKNLAYQIADKHTIKSAFCQASNFIRKDGDKLLADTTDGYGLLEDVVYNKKFQLSAKKILIIGSGFVLDTILLDMIVHNPAQISILARNEKRVKYLAHKFATRTFDPLQSYDLVFNSTPNSPDNNLFVQVKHLNDGALCYDLTYSRDSIFLQQMKSVNTTIYGYNGLGMLVEQAKSAFSTLFKYTPDSALVLRQLAILGYL